MAQKEFIANVKELPQVICFIEGELDKFNVDSKTMMQFQLAMEELFVNIATYSYPDKNDGKCQITIQYDQEKQEIILKVEDNGIKFNPLKKEDPNTNLSAEEREVGGLGIFIVKETMDSVEYQYENQKNILTLRKKV